MGTDYKVDIEGGNLIHLKKFRLWYYKTLKTLFESYLGDKE